MQGFQKVLNLTSLRVPGAEVPTGIFGDDAGQNGVIFRPGAPSSGAFVATWAEVRSALAITDGAMTLYVDSSIAPAFADVGITDFQGRVFLRAGADVVGPGSNILTVPDGAILKDPAGIIFNLNVILRGTTGPTMAFSKAVAFGVFGGGLLDNQGTVPAIDVDPAAFGLILSAALGGQISATNAPIVSVPNAGQQLILTAFTAGNFQGPSVALGPVGANLQVIFDASAQALPNVPGWLGTVNFSPIDRSSQVSYQPSNLADWSGIAPTSVANALDRIAAKITPIP